MLNPYIFTKLARIQLFSGAYQAIVRAQTEARLWHNCALRDRALCFFISAIGVWKLIKLLLLYRFQQVEDERNQ